MSARGRAARLGAEAEEARPGEAGEPGQPEAEELPAARGRDKAFAAGARHPSVVLPRPVPEEAGAAAVGRGGKYERASGRIGSLPERHGRGQAIRSRCEPDCTYVM